MIQDLRFAFRLLRRSPGFTATALLTMAIGIGAATAVFSVVYGVLLRPLPYPAANRLVRVSEEHPGAVSPLRDAMLSNLTYHAWRESPRTIDAIGAYSYREQTVQFDDGVRRVVGSGLTPSVFAMLGAKPALGRFFDESETKEGADHVVVLSDQLWHERFGADPAVVGRTLKMDDEGFTIVGIAPPAFYFPDRNTVFWSPRRVLEPSPDAVGEPSRSGDWGSSSMDWTVPQPNARVQPPVAGVASNVRLFPIPSRIQGMGRPITYPIPHQGR